MFKKIALFLFVIACAVLLFIAGRYSNKNKVKSATPYTSETNNNNSPSTTYTNKLLACSNSQNIDMRELKSFRKEVTTYINKCISENKDLAISYYFRDLNNGITIGVNEKEVFSPASLMKVPVLITILKQAEKNNDLLNTRIQYVKSNFNTVDEESGFAKVDQAYYTIDEYLRHMIVYSDNAATLLLAKFIGIENVLQTEKELNLSHNQDANSNTNFVSVLRYAAVFRILYNASYLNKSMSEKALQLLAHSNYSGGIRSAIPAQYPVAHKYGERDIIDLKGKRHTLQLHHFGIVYYNSKPYIIGVMTRGGENKAVKEKIIADLAEITFNAVDKQIKSQVKFVFAD